MKIKLTLLFLLIGITTYAQTAFERGFKDGYKEGYCGKEVGCVISVIPITPMPDTFDSKDSHKDGYNKGFLRGCEDKIRDNREKKQSYYSTPNTPNIEFKDFTGGGDNSDLLKPLPKIDMPSPSSINRQLWEQNRGSAIAIEKSYRSFNSYPRTILNGWHDVTCISNATNQSFSAKVNVTSNRITKIDPGESLGNNDISITFPAPINNAKASLQLTWNYDGSIKVFDVYFFEYLSNPNSFAKAPVKKGKISFWTDWKKAVGTKIYIEGECIGTFYGYFPDGKPDCEQNGTITYENKAGTYSYKAYTKKKGGWSGTIVIIEDNCSTKLLSD